MEIPSKQLEVVKYKLLKFISMKEHDYLKNSKEFIGNMYVKFFFPLLLFITISMSLLGQTYPTFSISESGTVINVSDYGAYPNDGIDDEDEIQAAVDAAGNGDLVLFQSGIYNLRKPDSRFTTNNTAHIFISNKTNITLKGAVDVNGEPATHVKRELTYADNSTGYLPSILKASSNSGIKLENLTFTNDQLFNTVGKVISKDASSIKVEILDGYPVDDGCSATAANVWTWDEATQNEGDEILKVGAPSVTYTTGPIFSKVSGTSSQMQATHTGFDNFSSVDVGDYLSWHYGFTSVGTIYLYKNTNTHLENVHIYSALRSSLFVAYGENIYANNVEIRPENDRFAMSPRDGLHASRNKGEFVFDNLYVKGTRLDAFVVTGTAAEVYSKTDAHNLQFITDQSIGSFSYNTNQPLYFNDNGVNHKINVNSVSYVSGSTAGSIYDVVTNEDVPSFVQVGTNLIPAGVSPDTVIVKNSIFKSIAGSSQILFCSNLLSDNNSHENTMYAAIRFGANPTRNHAGNNFVVSNSTFKDCAWEVNLNNPTDETDEFGCINIFNASTDGFDDMDISNVSIINNQFESNYSATGTNAGRAAIILDETRDITISGNTFSGFTEDIQLRDVYGELIVETEGIESGATYRIENLSFGNYIRGYDPNSSNTHSNNAYVTNYRDVPSWSTQKWVITKDPDFSDCYHIKNVYSDRCLRGYGVGSSTPTADGAKLTVYDYNSWATLKWKIIPVDGMPDYYHIQSYYSGNYLEGSSADNSYLTQSSSSNTTTTCWKLHNQTTKSTTKGHYEEGEFDINNRFNISISPNPVVSEISINGNELSGKKVFIYNLSGSKILARNLDDNHSKINVSHLDSGIYLIIIKNETETENCYKGKLFVR